MKELEYIRERLYDIYRNFIIEIRIDVNIEDYYKFIVEIEDMVQIYYIRKDFITTDEVISYIVKDLNQLLEKRRC